MSKELQQQIEALETENEQLKRQLEQKTKVAARALDSSQQRSQHMEIGRQKNQDLDQLTADLEARAQELATANGSLEKEIYERQRAEQEVLETQKLYQSTLDLMPQNIIRKDKELKFAFGNNAYLRLLGMSLEELVGKSDYDLYPKELADKYIADDRNVLETGQSIDIIESHKAPTSDELLYVHVVKTPIRNKAGEVDGLQVVFWDVTERVKTEQRLAQERNLLRTLIDNVPDLIYVKDTQGNFMLVNQAHAHYMGVDTPDALVGKSDFDFYPAELAKQYQADELAIIESEQPLLSHEEININHKTGEQSWTSTTKVPFYDVQGNTLGMVGISRDVTARNQVEVEIKKRAAYMEIVAQVSIAASTILDVNELLQQVTDLTKESFGLYHAHIYLLNKAGDTLNLAAGAGEVGRQMVKQGWGIPLEREQSVVARAARTRQGIIINNVRKDSSWLPNPLLPDTRAELAVPMIVGDQLLGVLDVQVAQVNYFSKDDARIQTTLASQVAVALQNARLFEQAQRQARQEQILREVTAQISGATDPDAVVRASLRALGDALGRPTFVRLGKPDQLSTEPNPGNGQKNASDKKTESTRNR